MIVPKVAMVVEKMGMTSVKVQSPAAGAATPNKWVNGVLKMDQAKIDPKDRCVKMEAGTMRHLVRREEEDDQWSFEVVRASGRGGNGW